MLTRLERYFGFAAHELTSPLHVADHDSQVGLEKIDGFADAADLNRLLDCSTRRDCVLQRPGRGARRLVNAFRALEGEPLHLKPGVR